MAGAQKKPTCAECGSRFSSSYHLNRHLLTHTGERPHECPECGRAFAQRYHLHKHIRSHRGERPFECSDCGARLASRYHLLRHLRRTHSLPDAVVSSDDGRAEGKSYVCAECNEGFAKKRAFVAHLETHNDERKHKGKPRSEARPAGGSGEWLRCALCSAAFRQPALLRAHRRRHYGPDLEEVFPCEDCDASFTAPDHLRAHQRVHSGRWFNGKRFTERCSAVPLAGVPALPR